MKLIVFGASGAGTTTLGRSVAEKLNWLHLDADDYYWEHTDPPFEIKIPKSIGGKRLQEDYHSCPNVVVSGSLVTWGDYWNTAFDLAFFLRIPSKIRMERLRLREIERYGKKLETTPAIKLKSQEFLDWAEKYDDPNFDGKSIHQHQQWIEQLSCPTVHIEGDLTNTQRLEIVEEKLKVFSL